ncbi:methionine--tRNA ligase [Mycoplasma miroungirhinis]|uniref:Methionine--tRNA ligase n=1 Tax=Mycoplasma miroungirhinis TaxID=754516 RepID=A0A6M4JB42_9MOLU|nr:methionine--tRNA ligase [Mycoplasma miroungirhinis]QJR44130.1 methionine--tRNA ligase [Mycoplasma miroungirhinis]
MNKKTFYISTPIYYPNGKLHIGHFYTTTIANTLYNFKKLNGYDCYLVTGIDEHGQKIQKAAQKANIDTLEFVNQASEQFKDLWNKANLHYDFFSRTTSPKHILTIQKIFQKMLEKGYIYLGQYSGLYSISDEEYLTKTQAIEKDNKYYHPTSGHELVEITEETYFFDMKRFNQWIIDFYENNSKFISSSKVKNELLNNFINKGLEDLSVTRISFDWGIQVACESKFKHVIYVWLDALFNYLTALNYLEEDDSLYQKYWVNGTQRVHIVGKEITRFHCIYWPIFLKSLDINLPTKILSHGWIITSEGKMSKSKGNVVDPYKLIETYGAEQTKYFFMSQFSIDNDGVYDEIAFKNCLNSDLANNFGNLVNRTSAMINQSFSNGTFYDQDNLESLDLEVYKNIEQYFINYQNYFDNFEIDKALKEAISLSKTLNLYIDKTTPWKLKDNLQRLNIVLNTLLNGIYAVAVMLSVVLPNNMQKISEFLNIDKLDFNLININNKFDNKQINVNEILFSRIK